MKRISAFVPNPVAPRIVRFMFLIIRIVIIVRRVVIIIRGFSFVVVPPAFPRLAFVFTLRNDCLERLRPRFTGDILGQNCKDLCRVSVSPM